MNKAYKYLLTILLLISPIACRPFSIYGDYLPSAPFVGVNYYIEDYDNEYRVTMNSGSTSLSLSGTQTNTVLVQRTSGGVTYVTSTYSQGGVSGNGGNISLTGSLNLSSSLTNTQVVYRVIKFTIVLDNNYIGYIRPRITKSGNNTNLFQQDLAVNGRFVEFSIVDNDVSTTNPTYSITLSDFSLIQDNSTERWAFPIESYGFASYMLSNNMSYYTGINKYNSYSLPIFTFTTPTVIYQGYAYENDPMHFVLITNYTTANLSRLQEYFSLSYGQFTNFKTEFIVGRSLSSTGTNQGLMSCISFDVVVPASESFSLSTSLNNRNQIVIPVSANYKSANYYSTDFALNFGLSNELLDKLDIIANGTSDSNNSSDNLENSNSQVTSAVDDYNEIESNFNDSMNSALDDIDTTLTPSAMGSKFQASAIWVRNQFNRMTNNTPFGSIMGFSLLLGLSLLIIGKVFK